MTAEARKKGGILLRALPLSAAALFLAFLSLRSSLLDSLPGSESIAARIAPGNPQVVFNQPMLNSRTLDLAPGARDRTLEAFRRAPLASQPFLVAAISAIAAKDAKADDLLRVARHRNPRSRITRALMLDAFLREHRVAEAVPEFSVLSRLLPEASPLLLGELAKSARDPRLRPVLVRALQSNPTILDSLLKYLAAGNPDPALILDLARGQHVQFTGVAGSWQEALVKSLVGKGNYRDAYTLWNRFLAVPAGPGDRPLYNPAFQTRSAPPPFNWQLQTGESAIAEPRPDAGLYVEYYGRDSATIAQQLLMLSPGGYRLSMLAEGESDKVGSGLTWQLTCLPAGKPIMTIDLSSLSAGTQTLAANFRVDGPDCAAQQLRLLGTPGEFATTKAVSIRHLQLSAAGGS